MEYRSLGHTKLRVSAIAIGSWQLSGPITIDGKADGFPDIGKENAINLIRSCQDLGINLIDSAEIYGMGEGERRIGEAIRGNRDYWILSTKFGLRRGSQGERVVDCSPSTICSSLEGSLKRLGTDYVDIYLYHASPSLDALEAGKAVLDTLKQEGKIRFYGISTDNPQILRQMACRDLVDVVQFSQSLLNHPQDILDLVHEHDLGSMVRGAFQSGLLSGRYFHQRPQVSGEDIRWSWLNRSNTERYAVYEELLPTGFSMPGLALRYLLDFPSTHTIVLGGKSIADYQEAIRAFELPELDDRTQMAIAKLRAQLQRPSLKRRVANKVKQLLKANW